MDDQEEMADSKIKICIEEDKLVYQLSEKGTIKSTSKQHKVEQNGWDDEIDLDMDLPDAIDLMQFENQNAETLKMNKLDSTLTDFEIDEQIPYITYKSNFYIENIKVIDQSD